MIAKYLMTLVALFVLIFWDDSLPELRSEALSWVAPSRGGTSLGATPVPRC